MRNVSERPVQPLRRTSRHALLRYAIGWLLSGLAAAAVVLLLLRAGEDKIARRPAVDPLNAVIASGCVLEDPVGKSADVSRPPVRGPSARAVAEGVYASPVPRKRLVGALRRGVVVVQYERGLPRQQVALIERSFEKPIPRRVVAPDASGMTFMVAATAWGRVLGCSKLDGRVLRALHTFAARYGGRGPDPR